MAESVAYNPSLTVMLAETSQISCMRDLSAQEGPLLGVRREAIRLGGRRGAADEEPMIKIGEAGKCSTF